MVATRFALQDADGARSYDLRGGDSEGLGNGCILGDRFVAPSDLGVTDIVACGRYRDRDTWVVRTASGTSLIEKDASGRVVLEHPLPSMRLQALDDNVRIPWSRRGIAGDLPRFVPMVAFDGDHLRAVLIDLDSGEIVERSAITDNIWVLRDGAQSYVLAGFTARVAAFDPQTHKLGPMHPAASPASVAADDVNGGLFWTHASEATPLDAPGVRAIRLAPGDSAK